MITLTFVVDDINTVMLVYNQIQVRRSELETGPFVTVSGVGPITLISDQSSYELIDNTGTSSDWYISRYYSTVTQAYSSWSDPVLGSPGDLFYNPLYPDEISYGTSEQLVINRIRRLIGDPLGLRREYGEEAASSIHFDNKTYEFDEKGWPVSVTMGGTTYNNSNNPTVNGYRYLRFNEDISTITTISGVDYGVDIWYYSFRNSDRQILEAYDTCPPPAGLTTSTATSEAYMIQTAIELLYQELWEDSTENGALVRDEGSVYDPTSGIESRRKLIDNLQARLDELVKTLLLGGIEGVLLD